MYNFQGRGLHVNPKFEHYTISNENYLAVPVLSCDLVLFSQAEI